MAKRKIVTWRVADTPQSDLINKWLDKQKNIQVSLTNLVLHMIDRFGMRDITDYDIQKVLYQKFSSGTSKEGKEETDTRPLNDPDSKKDRDKENQDDDNDLYKNVDINNLF